MDAAGALLQQNHYLPFGEVRTDLPGSMPEVSATDFGYTSQRNLDAEGNANLGLMDYHARFYDDALGRFIQPDTVVPNAADPQSLNRYAYVMNDPIRFNDPTGHRNCTEDGYNCSGNYTPVSKSEKDDLVLGDGRYNQQHEPGNCYDRGYCSKEVALHKELDAFPDPARVSSDQMILYFGIRLLAPEEIRVLNSNGGALTAFNVNLATNNAITVSQDLFGNSLSAKDGELHNDPGDAFRHAYWSALLTRAYSAEFAEKFTTAHETEAVDSADEKHPREASFMDIHNNGVGIRIALSNPQASNKQLQDMIYGAERAGALYVWNDQDIYFSNTCPECVYP